MDLRLAAVALGIAVLGIIVGVTLSAVFPGRDLAAVVMSGSLGLIAIVFAASLLGSLERGLLPGVERDWGGLAGDAAGWRMSLPLVQLICTCLFAILAVASFMLLAPRHSGGATAKNPAAVVTPRPALPSEAINE